jgi:hypothetical protein
MGLFDLPAPALTWVDAGLAAVLPAPWRLVLWSVVAAVLTMALYWWLSPQKRIGEVKRQLAASKVALDRFSGEFQEAWPLMRTMLGQALRQVGLVVGPALVAMVPVLCLIAWLSTTYGYRFPETGAAVRVHTFPETFAATLSPAPATAGGSQPRMLLADPSGQIIHEQVLDTPVTTLHKRQWWNTFIGNPAGYLPNALGVERISIELPQNSYVPFGPAWLRGWEAVFFVGLFITALAIKLGFRIH